MLSFLKILFSFVHIMVFVTTYPMHQIESPGRNIAKSKLYLRGLNYRCTREKSARNERLDKPYVKRAGSITRRDRLIVEFEHTSREEITRISLNLRKQETPRAVFNDVSPTLMMSASDNVFLLRSLFFRDNQIRCIF